LFGNGRHLAGPEFNKKNKNKHDVMTIEFVIISTSWCCVHALL